MSSPARRFSHANPERERPRILNYSEEPNEGWHWYRDELAPDALDWTFFYTRPRGWLGRLAKPRVRRYVEASRVAWHAARQRADLVVTHGPLLTWWFEEAARVTRPSARHLAFAFNLVSLPRGPRALAMRRAFRHVDRFVVHSTVERALYSEYFEIPLERIDMVHWAVRAPTPSPEAVARGEQAYVCAIGGNGRDYATLMRAAAMTPHVPYVCVVRPENMLGLKPPPNVHIECNVGGQRALDILFGSRFMVCPLASAEVPCGHVSLVNAMHLKKPLIITDSTGIHDYTVHGETALRVAPRDPVSMANAVLQLWEDAIFCAVLSRKAFAFAREYCSEERMVGYVRRYLEEHGLLPTAASADPCERTPTLLAARR
ncbi:MAG: glycosyltransferase [Myxococcales bacterium]